MKPILFNAEMVKAILEGRKTVTRRVVKFEKGKNPKWTGYVKDGLTLYNGKNEPCSLPAPYQVGDILYVRETWRWLPCFECGRDMWAVPCREGKFNHTYRNTGCYVFKADVHNCDADNLKWKPSIHMPKEAARIFLRVTGVRVERLQDMTLDDFKAEGTIAESIVPEDDLNYRFCFSNLWDSTIKKDQIDTYGWCANPYVWVIEFEDISEEITYTKIQNGGGKSND